MQWLAISGLGFWNLDPAMGQSGDEEEED
jgi:hypothetical protein